MNPITKSKFWVKILTTNLAIILSLTTPKGSAGNQVFFTLFCLSTDIGQSLGSSLILGPYCLQYNLPKVHQQETFVMNCGEKELKDVVNLFP